MWKRDLKSPIRIDSSVSRFTGDQDSAVFCLQIVPDEVDRLFRSRLLAVARYRVLSLRVVSSENSRPCFFAVGRGLVLASC